MAIMSTQVTNLSYQDNRNNSLASLPATSLNLIQTIPHTLAKEIFLKHKSYYVFSI